jgi:hypothetical protein
MNPILSFLDKDKPKKPPEEIRLLEIYERDAQL